MALGGGGGGKIYGVRIVLEGVSGTAVLQRATNSGFSINLVEVGQYVGNQTVDDVTGNTGVTYYYRAKNTAPGFADSAWSSTISSAPYDLGVL
jgi:hypothetical protein